MPGQEASSAKYLADAQVPQFVSVWKSIVA